MNTIVKCAQCKWWEDKPYLNIEENPHIKVCLVHQCTHPKVNGEADVYDLRDGLTQCGVDAGYPSNCTGPDFGCVHGETT